MTTALLLKYIILFFSQPEVQLAIVQFILSIPFIYSTIKNAKKDKLVETIREIAKKESLGIIKAGIPKEERLPAVVEEIKKQLPANFRTYLSDELIEEIVILIYNKYVKQTSKAYDK